METIKNQMPNFKNEMVPAYNVTIKYLSTINQNVQYRVFIDGREVCLVVVPDYSWADDRGAMDRAMSVAWKEVDRILKSESDRLFDNNFGLMSGSYVMYTDYKLVN